MLRSMVARSVLLLLGCFVALLLMEAAVRLLPFFQDARSAARAQMENARAEAQQPGGSEAASSLLQVQLHPYLGWIRRPGSRTQYRAGSIPIFPGGEPTPWATENARGNVFGLLSSVDDYREVSESDFVIGIFGGSVAGNLGTLGGEALRDAVEARFPALAGRVVILNFGSGAYKQPQQVIWLVQSIALGVPFDLVVNIDGYNEVVLGAQDARRGSHPLFPSRNHYASAIALGEPQLGTEQIELMAEISRERRRARELARRLGEGTVLRHSALARTVAVARIRAHAARAVLLEERLQELTAGDEAGRLAELPDACLASDAQCWDLIAGIWERSSTMMAALSRQIGAVYLHALQPNQYVAGSKVLSEDEQAFAYRPSRRARDLATGYQHLGVAAERLLGEGIAYHDLTMIFADHPETLYRDPCCHYNLRGNEILAAELAARIDEDAIRP